MHIELIFIIMYSYPHRTNHFEVILRSTFVSYRHRDLDSPDEQLSRLGDMTLKMKTSIRDNKEIVPWVPCLKDT